MKSRMERNREINAEWFFRGGYEGMSKLDQVEFLVQECGYTENGAWDLVYGTSESECSEDYIPDDYYGD